jgi:hypothetical protein
MTHGAEELQTMKTDDVLDQMPYPVSIHERLGELVREQQLLRRVLRLALAVREQRAPRRAGQRGFAKTKERKEGGSRRATGT